MARTFNPIDLVALPKMTAVGTATLLRALLTAADSVKKLPASLAADLSDLRAAHDNLQAILRQRLIVTMDEPPTEQEADRAEDTAWSALFGWLTAWAKLPSHMGTQPAEAQSVLTAILSSGLRFTQIHRRDQWQESETRLGIIQEKKLDTTINKLGGTPFLTNLKQAHKTYGEVLGITAVIEVVDMPDVRKAFEEATEALRTYVLRVSAYVRKSDPSTAELAALLLEPLASWERASAKATSTAEASAPTEGSQPEKGEASADEPKDQ